MGGMHAWSLSRSSARFANESKLILGKWQHHHHQHRIAVATIPIWCLNVPLAMTIYRECKAEADVSPLDWACFLLICRVGTTRSFVRSLHFTLKQLHSWVILGELIEPNQGRSKSVQLDLIGAHNISIYSNGFNQPTLSSPTRTRQWWWWWFTYAKPVNNHYRSSDRPTILGPCGHGHWTVHACMAQTFEWKCVVWPPHFWSINRAGCTSFVVGPVLLLLLVVVDLHHTRLLMFTAPWWGLGQCATPSGHGKQTRWTGSTLNEWFVLVGDMFIEPRLFIVLVHWGPHYSHHKLDYRGRGQPPSSPSPVQYASERTRCCIMTLRHWAGRAQDNHSFIRIHTNTVALYTTDHGHPNPFYTLLPLLLGGC